MCLTIDPMDNHITQLEHVLLFQTKQQKNENERVHQCQAKTAAIHSILCHHWTGLVFYLKHLSTCKNVLEYNFICEIESIFLMIVIM